MKKTPCEECRNQKRKCNGLSPCDRCDRLSLACVYIKSFSPEDQELLEQYKQDALQGEVDDLTRQIDALQATMQQCKQMQLLQDQLQPQSQRKKPRKHREGQKKEPKALIAQGTMASSIATMVTTNTTALTTTTSMNNHGHMPGLGTMPMQWTLELANGRLRFKVPVKTHGDLLHHIGQFVVQSASIPTTVERATYSVSLYHLMLDHITKKYVKTQFKTTRDSLAMMMITNGNDATPPTIPSASNSPFTMLEELMHQNVDSPLLSSSPFSTSTTAENVHPDSPRSFSSPGTSPSPFAISFSLDLAPSLLRTYLSCMHRSLWMVEPATMTHMLLNQVDGNDANDPLDENPARPAFCAFLCTFPTACTHLDDVIPRSLRRSYADMYYQMARDRVAELFDQPSLSLLTAYVFMALYHWQCVHEEDSDRYMDMSCRLATLLFPQYPPIHTKSKKSKNRIHQEVNRHDKNEKKPSAAGKGDDNESDDHDDHDHDNHDHDAPTILSPAHLERIHLARLLLFMYRARGSTFQYPSWTPILKDLEEDAFYATATEDSAFGMLQQLRASLSHAFDDEIDSMHAAGCQPGYVASGLIHTLSVRIESSTLRWYERLPQEFRLHDILLFDAGAYTDDVFFHIVAPQPLLPMLLSFAIYEHFVFMGLTTAPKSNDPTKIDFWRQLQKHPDLEDPNSPVALHSPKWKYRRSKFRALRESVGFKGGDDEFLALMEDMHKWGADATARMHYPIMWTALNAAVNAVRLCFHLHKHRMLPCYADKHVLALSRLLLERIDRARFIDRGLPPTMDRLGPEIPAYLQIAQSLLDA
ncbi:hypothetical protein BC940DRAFT_290757 [Gongronella butleri]|nr:hypothetical protein BC940DRAFT_290757 [Gongronella butleri]